MGEDVENILLKLIQAADYDVKRAETGIIYIDEIDKIARKSENPSITRDVSGRGRAAGAAEDPRGHDGLGAAPGRPQAPPSGVHPDRHHQHPVHLRRGLRRHRHHHREPDRPEGDGLPGRGAQGSRAGRLRAAPPRASRGPDEVRADPRVHRSAARGERGLPPLQGRAHPHSGRAEERADPAVPADLRARPCRAGAHRRRARGGGRAGPAAGYRGPRPPGHPRRGAARGDVRPARAGPTSPSAWSTGRWCSTRCIPRWSRSTALRPSRPGVAGPPPRGTRGRTAAGGAVATGPSSRRP